MANDANTSFINFISLTTTSVSILPNTRLGRDPGRFGVRAGKTRPHPS